MYFHIPKARYLVLFPLKLLSLPIKRSSSLCGSPATKNVAHIIGKCRSQGKKSTDTIYIIPWPFQDSFFSITCTHFVNRHNSNSVVCRTVRSVSILNKTLEFECVPLTFVIIKRIGVAEIISNGNIFVCVRIFFCMKFFLFGIIENEIKANYDISRRTTKAMNNFLLYACSTWQLIHPYCTNASIQLGLANFALID